VLALFVLIVGSIGAFRAAPAESAVTVPAVAVPAGRSQPQSAAPRMDQDAQATRSAQALRGFDAPPAPRARFRAITTSGAPSPR
jgi:hypothetical protein